MIINTSDCKDIHVYSHRNPVTEQLNISNRDEGGRPCRGVKYKHEWKQTIAGPENTTTQPQDSTL